VYAARATRAMSRSAAPLLFQVITTTTNAPRGE
jgi:hypothetical protein